MGRAHQGYFSTALFWGIFHTKEHEAEIEIGSCVVEGFRNLPRILLPYIVATMASAIGTVMLIFPDIYVWSRFSLIIPAAIFANIRGPQSISEHWAYTSSHSRELFGYIFLLAILPAFGPALFAHARFWLQFDIPRFFGYTTIGFMVVVPLLQILLTAVLTDVFREIRDERAEAQATREARATSREAELPQPDEV